MGKQWKQCQTLFFGAPKSLPIVTASMKLKDAYFLGLLAEIADGKASVYDVGDAGLIPGLGRFLGEGNGNPSTVLAWRIPGMGSLAGCRLWGHTESDTTEVI